MKHLLKIFLPSLLFVVIFSCGDEQATITNPTQNEGDPIQTPVGVPDGAPVTANIGPTGGSLMTIDSSLEISVPPGALSSAGNITIQPVTNFCPLGTEHAYRFSPAIDFNDSVTIRFKYSQNTYSGIFGAARQTDEGYWKNINGVVIDTINRIVSFKLKSFSVSGDMNKSGGENTEQRAGGGDVSIFERYKMIPNYYSLRVTETIPLAVIDVRTTGDEELISFLPPTINQWLVNGSSGGGSTYGTITQVHGSSCVYKAPNNVPALNSVKVTAVASAGNQLVYVDGYVKIIRSHITYDIKLDVKYNPSAYAGYICELTDGANVVVDVNSAFPPTVNIPTGSIENKQPVVTPISYAIPGNGGTITWIPDAAGVTNIVNASGFVHGEHLEVVTISFMHNGTVIPKFFTVPSNGPPFYTGGHIIPGLPVTLTFKNNDSTHTVVDQSNGVTATITPRE